MNEITRNLISVSKNEPSFSLLSSLMNKYNLYKFIKSVSQNHTKHKRTSINDPFSSGKFLSWPDSWRCISFLTHFGFWDLFWEDISNIKWCQEIFDLVYQCESELLWDRSCWGVKNDKWLLPVRQGNSFNDLPRGVAKSKPLSNFKLYAQKLI